MLEGSKYTYLMLIRLMITKKVYRIYKLLLPGRLLVVVLPSRRSKSSCLSTQHRSRKFVQI